MGIFDRFRKKKKKEEIQNTDFKIDDKYNDLLNNNSFQYILMRLSLSKEDIVKLHKDFLDKCLDEKYFNFLTQIDYMLNNDDIEKIVNNVSVLDDLYKYNLLIDNYLFLHVVYDLNINKIEAILTLPKEFLDKCLDEKYLEFLYSNRYSIDKELMLKIINNTLTLDDLGKENMSLIELIEPSKRVTTLANRDFKTFITTGEYVEIKVDDNLSCDVSLVPMYINSYIDGIKILYETKKVVDTCSFDEECIKVLNKKTNEFYKDKYIIDDNSIINKDSIIVLSYEKYIELSRNPKILEILSSHMFFISDNYDEYNPLHNINKAIPFGGFDPNYDYEITNLMKYNHIKKIILDSNLEDIQKKYYLYLLYKSDFFDKEKTIKTIIAKIGNDEIERITNEFNKLSFEDKTKPLEKQQYISEFFYYENPDFFEFDLKKQIDILCYYDFEKLELILKDNKIKDLFKDINNYNDLIKLKKILEKTDEITDIECIKKFVDRQGLDVSEILKTPEYDLKTEYMINPILAQYFITDEKEKMDISMEDIVGIEKFHMRNKSNNILDNFSNFFNDNGDGYHRRGLSMLEFKDGSDALKKLYESFTKEPLKLSSYDDKYIVSGNGLHRTMVLRFLYIKELLEGKLTKEELKEKYKIPNCIISKVNYEKTYLRYLLKSYVKNIKNVFNDTQGGSSLVVYFSDSTSRIMTTNEIKEILKETLINTDSKAEIIELKNYYNNYPSFKTFMDNNFKEFIDKMIESEELDYGKVI